MLTVRQGGFNREARQFLASRTVKQQKQHYAASASMSFGCRKSQQISSQERCVLLSVSNAFRNSGPQPRKWNAILEAWKIERTLSTVSTEFAVFVQWTILALQDFNSVVSLRESIFVFFAHIIFINIPYFISYLTSFYIVLGCHIKHIWQKTVWFDQHWLKITWRLESI